MMYYIIPYMCEDICLLKCAHICIYRNFTEFGVNEEIIRNLSRF